VGATACLAGIVRDRFGAGLIVEPGQRHVGTLLCQRPADRRPDACCAPVTSATLPANFHRKIPVPDPTCHIRPRLRAQTLAAISPVPSSGQANKGIASAAS